MASIKGHKVSNQFREKTRKRQTGAGNSFFGRKHSAESLAKISKGAIKTNKNRIYSHTPFQLLKKKMALQNLGWCRMCKAWLPLKDIDKYLCKNHKNEEARKLYAANPEKVRLRKYARKRGLNKIPVAFKIALFEKFNYKCAYCGDPATTIDHFFPVKLGGNSTPDNLLPCCSSCNPSKKHKHPSLWDFELTEDIIDMIMPSLFNPGQIHHLIN